MAEDKPKKSAADLAVRCHEIQVGLSGMEVPEFDQLVLIGMAVRLALHIRGLPSIDFKVLKLVGYRYLDIPTLAARTVAELLEEVEFVKLGKQGRSIKTVVPNVPYYEDLYSVIGNYAVQSGFNEAEQLSIELLQRLSRSPEKLEALRGALGADNKLFNRAIAVGEKGSYLRQIRARGRDILMSPTYFSENPELFADVVAAGGAKGIQKVISAIGAAQGYPLTLVEKTNRIGACELTDDEVRLTVRLAQDGVVRPPSILTQHSGENFFLFTPTPAGAALAPTKRDIYEKAMAIVAAVRQGQFLPRQFAIREPGAVLYTLKRDLKLGRATTEAAEQYRNLVHLRVAQLIDIGHGYKELRVIDTEENREALNIAYSLVSSDSASGMEIDNDARKALQEDQLYIDSLVSSGKLRKNRKVPITEQHQQQLDLLFLK